MKIALGQINPTVGDFSGNASKIIDFSRRAQAAGAGLILFPELSVCGYPPRDLVERPSFVARNRETVERIAAETRGIAVICGLVTPAHSDTGKAVMNSAALLMDGKIAFIQSKMLLPTYDVFDEMRNFAPAKSQELFSFCGNRMALTICEDAWNDKHFWRKRLYTVDPVESLIQAGGNFVLNISASPFWIGKREFRRDMLASIARQHKVPVVLVNQVGGNDSLVFDGSSLVLNREGQVIAQGRSFEEDLIYFDSKRSDRRNARTDCRRRSQRLFRAGAGHARLHAQMRISESDHRPERRHRLRADRRHRRRCGRRRKMSSASACPARIPRKVPSTTPAPWPRILASASNCFRSIRLRGLSPDAARRIRRTERRRDRREYSVARPRHVADGAVEQIRRDRALHRQQERTRRRLLHALWRHGRRLAVISDVPKTLVYRLSHYVNSRRAVIPQATLEKPPSAELRPDQKDSDSLPPYEVLDAVLEDYVEDSHPAEQIAADRGFDIETVRRVIRMVDRAEYKRQQAAPGLKISPKAFGYGRRFPIAAKCEA